MKKVLIYALACIALVISSCNQNSPAPAPSPSSPTPTPTPTSSMTATEAALVGDWIFDYQEFYSGGNLSPLVISPTTYTIYAGNHMVLKSSLYTTAPVPNGVQYYQGDFYSGTSAASAMWYVTTSPIAPNPEILHGTPMGMYTSQDNYIITLNATTLIYQAWVPGQIANGHRTYFHK